MKSTHKLFFSLAFCSLVGVQIAYAASEQTITYKNQRGSTMTLIFHQEEGSTGTLTGTFTTAVGNCKTDVGVPQPLSGYYNGNAIAVTFNFPHCKQVVAMTGNLLDGKNKIQTLWLDAQPAKDPHNKDWDSNIIGSDSYDKTR